MAIANPINLHDLYGERYTFFTDSLAVKFVTDLRTSPISAFNQAVADSPIAAVCDRAGKLTVTYLAADGSRLTKSSSRDGDAGTWA